MSGQEMNVLMGPDQLETSANLCSSVSPFSPTTILTRLGLASRISVNLLRFGLGQIVARIAMRDSSSVALLPLSEDDDLEEDLEENLCISREALLGFCCPMKNMDTKIMYL